MIQTNQELQEAQNALAQLSSQTLAKALADLAVEHEVVHECVTRLISTPTENLKRFKESRAELVAYDLDDHEAASQFKALMEDLKAAAIDHDQALLMTIDLLPLGWMLSERNGDYDELIQSALNIDLRELFKHVAAKARQPLAAWVPLHKLHWDSDYCDAFDLIEALPAVLKPSDLQAMARLIQEQLQEEEAYDRGKYQDLLITVARFAQNPDLAETAFGPESGDPTDNQIMEIAQLYLENNQAETAYHHLQKIKDKDSQASTQQVLLFDIHQALGNRQKAQTAALDLMRCFPSKDHFERMQTAYGQEAAQEQLQKLEQIWLEQDTQLEAILNALLELDRLDTLERIILARPTRIGYGPLLDMAEAMGVTRPMAATIVYRIMVDDILDRGRTHRYAEAVSHIQALEQHGVQITDWGDVGNHEWYLDNLKRDHGRKYSFWGKMKD